MIRRRTTVVLLALLALVGGCTREPSAVPAPHAERDPAAGVMRVAPEQHGHAARLVLLPHDFVAPAGPTTETARPRLRVEVASTDSARRRGLGGRGQLAPDDGMLFVYAVARPRTFWMKDCAIGLDIAFLDDEGRIVHVATLGPGTGLTGAAIPRATCPQPARYVLETNAGRLAELGVGTGDRVDLSAPTAGVVAE